MNTQRNIKQTWKVNLQKKSNIHEVGLILPPGEWNKFDPFLLMAEDKFQSKAFGHHPHRGMETVTFVIDGELHHEDNKGGKGVLQAGDAQWMTAGSGLIHIEAPPENSTVHTLQLWVNLPRKNKMTPPRYQDILKKDAPVRKDDAAIYRVFSGSSADVVSPTKNYVPVSMVEMIIEAGYTAKQDIPSNYNGFLYVLEGSGIFGDNKVKAGKNELLLLDKVNNQLENSEISIKANKKLRVLLYAGRPLNEPVVARGPFVMNTEEEISRAYEDYRAGKF